MQSCSDVDFSDKRSIVMRRFLEFQLSIPGLGVSIFRSLKPEDLPLEKKLEYLLAASMVSTGAESKHSADRSYTPCNYIRMPNSALLVTTEL